METVDDVRAALEEHQYLADEGLATAIFLALRLQRPLLLEGEAGVGKTEVAKVLVALDRRRARAAAVLRGHRRRPGGLRVGLLAPAAAPARGRGRAASEVVEDELYSERFLVRRPLLRAHRVRRRRHRRRCCSSTRSTAPTTSSRRSCSRSSPTTSITVPELGTFRAEVPPIVVRHVEPHARRARRAEAPLPLPLDRAPRLRARARDRAACARPRCRDALARAGRGRGRGAARARALQAARRGGDDRLGAGARRARRGAARRARGRRHARHDPEVPRGPGAGARARRSASSCSTAVARSA